MVPMLKKFKEKIENFLKKQAATPNLDFGCRNVKVKEKNYLICRAVVPDIPEILAIERSVYQGDQPWDFTNFESQIKDKLTSLYIVVRYEDMMVAFAGCNFVYGKNEAHITNIAVLPEYQNRGLGMMMLETLLAEAKAYGCSKISLAVKVSNKKAQALYQSAGFKKRAVKEKYYHTEDGLEFEYDLLKKNLKKRVEKGWKKIEI